MIYLVSDVDREGLMMMVVLRDDIMIVLNVYGLLYQFLWDNDIYEHSQLRGDVSFVVVSCMAVRPRWMPSSSQASHVTGLIRSEYDHTWHLVKHSGSHPVLVYY